ncbi:MAG: type II toxin-antitoxin system RelE/ParE family toxin [Terricaulis sp.]
MRRVDITVAAEHDLDAIGDFIAADNPHAAIRVVTQLKAAIDKLAFMPTARAGSIAGTFEKPVRSLPYIIAFELPDKETLRSTHNSRRARLAGVWVAGVIRRTRTPREEPIN